MVAEVAYSMLSDAEKQNLHKYLGATTIEQASTWMDEVRSDHKYDYMKKWHYVNVEKGATYEDNKDENVVNELVRLIKELEHKEGMSEDDVKRDFLVLFHLVGDLHQPLHCGYEGDKGGNDIQVKYMGHPSNLHRVWDSEMIEGENITVNDCLLQLKNFDAAERKSLTVINVKNWMLQPRSQLHQVYNFKDETIDEAYVQRNKKLVEEDILLGGMRLAAVLKEVCKS